MARGSHGQGDGKGQDDQERQQNLYLLDVLLERGRKGAQRPLKRHALSGHLGRGLPPQFAEYACILKNSVAHKETATERIFLMKDLAAVEEAA